jgi:alpha-galactosidase/6-phospho-beta-glucosidase family protein
LEKFCGGLLSGQLEQLSQLGSWTISKTRDKHWVTGASFDENGRVQVTAAKKTNNFLKERKRKEKKKEKMKRERVKEARERKERGREGEREKEKEKKKEEEKKTEKVPGKKEGKRGKENTRNSELHYPSIFISSSASMKSSNVPLVSS